MWLLGLMKYFLPRFSPSIVCSMLMLAAVLAGCVTAPETGRKQLIMISQQEELSLGLTGFEQTKKETPISKDARLNEMVQRVGRRIAAVANLPGAQWEFVVFESKQANAFCMPGGKVGIYTGILPITKDEAGLAAVMGHEVAHAVARHGAERVTHGLVTQAGGSLVQAGLAKTEGTTQQIFTSLYAVGANIAVLLPYDRKQESEADHNGLLYMARAGYPPEEAIKFWERFSEANKLSGGGSSTPWFLRTHPLDEVRIQQLKDWLPKAQAEYKPPGK